MNSIRVVLLVVLTIVISSSKTFGQQEYVDSLKHELTVQVERDTNRVNLLVDVVRSIYRSEAGLAKNYALEALEISEAIGFKKGEAKANRSVGAQYFITGRPDSALIYFEKAYQIYQKLNDYRGIAITKGAIGSVYAVMDDFENAITTFLDAVSAYEAMEEYAPAAVTYNNIGNLYLEQELFDKAILNYQKSLDAFDQTDQKRQESLPYSGLATAYSYLEEFDKASEYVDEGIKIAKNNNLISNLGYLYETAGDIKNAQGFKEEAGQYIQMAIEIFNRFGNLGKITDLQFALAALEFENGNFNAAQDELLSAVETLSGNNLGMARLESDVYQLLSKTESELGNYENAAKYALLSKSISDSLYKQENALKISELETIYETRKKEDQIKLLQYENEVAELRVWNIAVIGAAIILIILIVFWLVIKRRARERKIELRSVQRELEQYGVLLSEKNTFLKEIIDGMEEVVVDVKTMSSRKQMHSLIQSLQRNINVSDSDDRLFNKIEQVNAGFFLALKKKVGDLSPSEKKLASLVQMDLTNKDIANILNINPKSVNQAKYRLKKKIGLEGEEDLKSYLNSLANA